MATRLADAGFELKAFDVLAERARPLLELGAASVASPKEAAEGAEALVVMVANAEQAKGVLFGEGDAAGALTEGAAVVVMSTIGPEAIREIADGLAERGVLRREDGKILGLFNSTKFPEADSAPEAGVREGVAAVLRSQRQPTEREAMLIALLRAYDLVPKMVAKEDRKAAKQRAKEVADEGIAGKAVSDTLKATEAAIIAGIAASAATTAATSGS